MREIKVEDIIRKPRTTTSSIDIMGIKFVQLINEPNVFVILTRDRIKEGDDVYFFFEGLRYILMECIPHKIEDPDPNKRLIECRYWSEKVWDK